MQTLPQLHQYKLVPWVILFSILSLAAAAGPGEGGDQNKEKAITRSNTFRLVQRIAQGEAGDRAEARKKLFQHKKATRDHLLEALEHDQEAFRSVARELLIDLNHSKEGRDKLQKNRFYLADREKEISEVVDRLKKRGYPVQVAGSWIERKRISFEKRRYAFWPFIREFCEKSNLLFRIRGQNRRREQTAKFLFRTGTIGDLYFKHSDRVWAYLKRVQMNKTRSLVPGKQNEVGERFDFEELDVDARSNRDGVVFWLRFIVDPKIRDHFLEFHRIAVRGKDELTFHDERDSDRFGRWFGDGGQNVVHTRIFRVSPVSTIMESGIGDLTLSVSSYFVDSFSTVSFSHDEVMGGKEKSVTRPHARVTMDPDPDDDDEVMSVRIDLMPVKGKEHPFKPLSKRIWVQSVKGNVVGEDDGRSAFRLERTGRGSSGEHDIDGVEIDSVKYTPVEDEEFSISEGERVEIKVPRRITKEQMDWTLSEVKLPVSPGTENND